MAYVTGGPSSGVSGGGLDAVRAGMRKGSGGGDGGGSPWASRGQFKRFMQMREWERDQDRVDTRQKVIDDDTKATRDTARDVFKTERTDASAGKQRRSDMKLSSKLEQAATTSQRIYEESTKETQFARDQKGLSAASRRTMKENKAERAGRMEERMQAFNFGGGASATSVNIGSPKSGDTISFAQPKSKKSGGGKSSVQADIT